MKRILLLTGIAVLAGLQGLQAQTDTKTKAATTDGGQAGYTSGIGVRFGVEGGISFKHFIKDDRAIEAILSTGFGYGGFRLTGLYEVHKPFPGVEGLDWFFGGGAHIGMYSGRYYNYYGSGYWDNNGNWRPYRSNYMTLGIDGIIGLEYQFEDLPFTAALDFKPFFDFVGRGSRYGDGALTIRYILK